ncbi:isochorismatase family protein [Marinovum sp. 2_MG-2023]|uniref:isochorismatase family protein n=1 Tax=Roseobacteraceae TaxID=2854170 RepID=UPI001FD1ED98|nr:MULTISPECIES: isochorismatase family protein [Roseobacteraceae]MCJ7874128.1 isochorismatase family protein [Phaeobacter sp. J2-8]MDO6730874.1 isochorismatase family protein [Marinovum sp. 2_MG-2023]MDO6780101.1 isochorismatase family protein [Marinovum sp. 1_MG-2023]
MKDAQNVKCGFDRSVPVGRRPALLVIDFQRGFTEPDLCPLASDCSAAVDATAQLIKDFRGLGPLIFTINGYAENLSDMGRWGEKCSSLAQLVRGTPPCELDPRLGYSAEHDTIVQKTQASAFFGTHLSGMLAAAGCDMLMIAGCTTSGCVRASANDAMAHGYPPFVVRDCVADRTAAQHESNLIDIHSKYGEVITLDDALSITTDLRG